MTIKECIDMVDNVKPNQYSIEDKVIWLSFLDSVIINDVLKTHEGYDGRYDTFVGYSPDRLSDHLIVPSPYDRLYTAYLKMKIDEENGETARYNNSAITYNSYLTEYKRWYNKTHMPLTSSERNKKTAPAHGTLDVTDAQLEYLRRVLLADLSNELSKLLSEDRIYDIIMNHVNTHTSEFRGKDGEKGNDGKSAYQYAKEGGYTGTEAEFARKLASEGISANTQLITVGDIDKICST